MNLKIFHKFLYILLRLVQRIITSHYILMGGNKWNLKIKEGNKMQEEKKTLFTQTWIQMVMVEYLMKNKMYLEFKRKELDDQDAMRDVKERW